MSGNPFRIDGPAVISFSGGRTSAMMLWNILVAHHGKLPDDVHVLFANTGKEMPETLDFVRECSERWNVPIVWLEYADHDDPQRRWIQVDYATASRAGEPFAALIRRNRILPNPRIRACTSELKIRVMKLYTQQQLEFAHWDFLIGFRADEPSRVAKLSIPLKEPYDRYAPMASAGITARDVADFWASINFDLALPNNNGRTMHGNCDLCYLKGSSQLLSLIREDPSRADWWVEMEAWSMMHLGKRELGGGFSFRNDRPSYATMRQMALDQGELFGFADDPLADCGCTD